MIDLAPAVQGILVAIPSLSLGYLAYRHSVRVDATTAEDRTISQIIAGLNTLVSNLQEDNRLLRQSVDGLNKLVINLQGDNRLLQSSVDGLKVQLQVATTKIDQLTQELRALSGQDSGANRS